MNTIDDIFVSASLWLSECTKHHQICQRREAPVHFPSRLLYIPERQSTTLLVQVVETSRTEVGINYCALSYCWGTTSDNFGVTVKENLPYRKKAFNITELPKTIQDAISISRRLGIFYIWIDSICIMQDDIEDWAIQAAMMDEIYANSLITLVAVSSAHANEGLFDSRWVANKRSWLPSKPETLGVSPFRLITNSWMFAEQDIQSSLSTRVATRAWTLQEEVLSRRVLFWTNHGVVWLCPTCVKREWNDLDRQQSSHNKFDSNEIGPFYPKLLENRHSAFIHRDASYNIAREVWEETLGNYLRRNISISSDRLTAIGGVAKTLQGQLGDIYFAGLWQSRVPEDLLWGKIHITYEDTIRRQPSWSWASLPESCTADAWLGYYCDIAAKTTCDVQSIKIDPPNASMYGPITSGVLRLRGLKKSFPGLHMREWLPACGPGFRCSEFHVAVDMDVTDSNQLYDRVQLFKVLELLQHDFCLIIEPIDQHSNSTGFRRMGRAEIIYNTFTSEVPFLHSFGHLKGVRSTDNSAPKQNGYFEDCEPVVIELI